MWATAHAILFGGRTGVIGFKILAIAISMLINKLIGSVVKFLFAKYVKAKHEKGLLIIMQYPTKNQNISSAIDDRRKRTPRFKAQGKGSVKMHGSTCKLCEF